MNAIQALVSTFNGGIGRQQSQFATFSFVITQEFEAFIPIVITNPNTGNISAGAEVQVYRSTDNGATWETVGTFAQAFPRPTAAQVQRRDVNVKTGWYIISVCTGGGQTSTWTVQMLTAYVITAYA